MKERNDGRWEGERTLGVYTDCDKPGGKEGSAPPREEEEGLSSSRGI